MTPSRAFTLTSVNELPSELRGFAFKNTDLIYFAFTVKGFTCVSLVCREVHISYVESICERRRSLIPAVVVNSPAEELFAGVRSPENKEPSKLRHTQTFTHATQLVCYEISVNFNYLKGQKNVGTSRYFLAKTHYHVYILWRDAQKRKTSTY